MKLSCRLLGHEWRDHWRFEEFNASRREKVGEPLVRDCVRCGRVESAAFTGRWARAKHLERGWTSPHSPAYDLGDSVPPLTDLGANHKGDWCGACGYTGHCKGPSHAACPQRQWHAWLEREVQLHEPWPSREDRAAAMKSDAHVSGSTAAPPYS